MDDGKEPKSKPNLIHREITMGIKDRITGASASTVAKSGAAAAAVVSLAAVSGPGTALLAGGTVAAIAALSPKDDQGKNGK